MKLENYLNLTDYPQNKLLDFDFLKDNILTKLNNENIDTENLNFIFKDNNFHLKIEKFHSWLYKHHNKNMSDLIELKIIKPTTGSFIYDEVNFIMKDSVEFLTANLFQNKNENPTIKTEQEIQHICQELELMAEKTKDWPHYSYTENNNLSPLMPATQDSQAETNKKSMEFQTISLSNGEYQTRNRRIHPHLLLCAESDNVKFINSIVKGNPNLIKISLEHKYFSQSIDKIYAAFLNNNLITINDYINHHNTLDTEAYRYRRDTFNNIYDLLELNPTIAKDFCNLIIAQQKESNLYSQNFALNLLTPLINHPEILNEVINILKENNLLVEKKEDPSLYKLYLLKLNKEAAQVLTRQNILPIRNDYLDFQVFLDLEKEIMDSTLQNSTYLKNLLLTNIDILNDTIDRKVYSGKGLSIIKNLVETHNFPLSKFNPILHLTQLEHQREDLLEEKEWLIKNNYNKNNVRGFFEHITSNNNINIAKQFHKLDIINIHSPDSVFNILIHAETKNWFQLIKTTPAEVFEQETIYGEKAWWGVNCSYGKDLIKSKKVNYYDINSQGLSYFYHISQPKSLSYLLKKKIYNHNNKELNPYDFANTIFLQDNASSLFYGKDKLGNNIYHHLFSHSNTNKNKQQLNLLINNSDLVVNNLAFLLVEKNHNQITPIDLFIDKFYILENNTYVKKELGISNRMDYMQCSNYFLGALTNCTKKGKLPNELELNLNIQIQDKNYHIKNSNEFFTTLLKEEWLNLNQKDFSNLYNDYSSLLNKQKELEILQNLPIKDKEQDNKKMKL